ncbi:hypothetical protein OG453_39120 [Streptomyces sp. NBC_01381]|uniref:hypothetical protein n=1 Tax=Streptomyces sp. NBC_01381 TaxID=2903845 RepID=UPI002255B6FD|nr:hypothetical protein [Streptomyces sp. NBC_01381]MCX4672592.1 hypothetical protein [Streptomyces sp. NBC_01381]
MHAVAAATGVTDHTTRSQEEALADRLEDKRLLLVLDSMAFTRGTQLSVDQAVALALDPAPKPL